MSTKAVVPWQMVVTEEANYDKDTQRYYMLLYIDFGQNKDAYIQCSCSGMTGQGLGNMTDFAIEFLTSTGLNCMPVPYNKDLFDDIEIEAWNNFIDLIEGAMKSEAQ